MKNVVFYFEQASPLIMSWTADDDVSLVGINPGAVDSTISLDPLKSHSDHLADFALGVTEGFVIFSWGQPTPAANYSELNFQLNRNQTIYCSAFSRYALVQLFFEPLTIEFQLKNLVKNT